MVVFMNFCTVRRLNRCQVIFIIRTEMIVYSLTLLRVQSSFACRGRTWVPFVTWLNDGVSTVICLAFHGFFFTSFQYYQGTVGFWTYNWKDFHFKNCSCQWKMFVFFSVWKSINCLLDHFFPSEEYICW